jgi:hypothetical protein
MTSRPGLKLRAEKAQVFQLQPNDREFGDGRTAPFSVLCVRVRREQPCLIAIGPPRLSFLPDEQLQLATHFRVSVNRLSPAQAWNLGQPRGVSL